jgi:hypothetical protein
VPRHDGAAADRIEALAFHLPADLRIDEARGGNAGAAIARQRGDAGLGAPVQRVRRAQQAGDDAAERGRVRRCGEERAWLDALRAQPVMRQVEAAVARILADVARDVGVLHRHAEIAGARQRTPIAHAHQQRHGGADRGGDARGIGFQRGFVGALAAFGVPRQPFQQRGRQRARNGEAGDDAGEGAVGRMREGTLRVDRIEPRLQLRHGVRIAAFVDQVVGDAAEGIERGSRFCDARRQQLRRGGEGFRAAGEHGAAGGKIGLHGLHQPARL